MADGLHFNGDKNENNNLKFIISQSLLYRFLKLTWWHKCDYYEADH